MRRSIKDYSITELSDLQYTLENLPLEIDNTLNINGEKVDIEEYFEKMQDDFFNVPDEEYRNAIGKIFLNKKDGVAFKVVGYNPVYPTNFFYKEYNLIDCQWKPSNRYNWLKESFKKNNPWKFYKPEEIKATERFRGQDDVFKNVASEGMYMFGKDGNMYVDYSCGGDYNMYCLVDYLLLQE